MPQIGPDLWKVALSYYWYREYFDGRVEQEFDIDTGQIMPWGSTPSGLKRVGWLPITPDLAGKMREHGEFGIPTRSPAIMIELKPGEELKVEIFKDCTVIEGYQIHCKACGAVYKSFGEPDAYCLHCGATPSWRCPKCDKLADAATCPDCNSNLNGRIIDPLEISPDKWEDVVYILGIKNLYRIKFNCNFLIVEH